MKPTIGRIVIYNTNEEDRELMVNHPECNVQLQLPAIIVAVWNDNDGQELINAKVITDGNMELWKTSIKRGNEEMDWNWPVI